MVWEKANGPIPTGMVVHHLNHNPQDNRLENLALIGHADHSRHHQTERNSFKGKKHTAEYKAQRSEKYRGCGNPHYRSDVKTHEIKILRGSGLNWSEIGRLLGISRGCAKKRLTVGE